MRATVPATSYIVTLPVTLLIWWLLESPKIVFKILKFILILITHQLGYGSLFKTFFKPWKNEYREGLVGFSIIMGMVIKGFLILIESSILFIILVSEIFIFAVWVLLPFIILWGLYVGIFA